MSKCIFCSHLLHKLSFRFYIFNFKDNVLRETCKFETELDDIFPLLCFYIILWYLRSKEAVLNLWSTDP